MSLSDLEDDDVVLEPPPPPPEKKGDEEEDGEEDVVESGIKGLDEEGERWRALLLQQFDEDQNRRYESYRRSKLPKAAVKRIMQNVTGQAVPPTAAIVMSSIAKIFVGEIVEEALDVQNQWRERGPLRPRHLRESYRRLQKRGLTQKKVNKHPLLS